MTPNKTVNIALVCKKRDFTYDAPGRVRSGNWKIAEHRRPGLIGSTVILTDSQKSPAYLGGKIIGVNPTHNGRVEVIFREDESLVGNTDTIGHPKWGHEKCYIV